MSIRHSEKYFSSNTNLLVRAGLITALGTGLIITGILLGSMPLISVAAVSLLGAVRYVVAYVMVHKKPTSDPVTPTVSA